MTQRQRNDELKTSSWRKMPQLHGLRLLRNAEAKAPARSKKAPNPLSQHRRFSFILSFCLLGCLSGIAKMLI